MTSPVPPPPALAQALLERVLGRDVHALAIRGDLWEDYVIHAERHGPRAARRWFWRAALALAASRVATVLVDAIRPNPKATVLEDTMPNRFAPTGLSRDLRLALRAMRREPGFFGLAVLIVGLGVGACTAVYSVMSPLMLRPLPFTEPERLVWIANDGDPENGMSAVTSRTSNLRDFRASSRSFTQIAGYNAFFEQGSYNLVGGTRPEKLVGADVTRDFIDVLGVRPLMGRNFDHAEGEYGGPAAVLLTHGFWTRRFGGDPAIVGTAIDINDVPTTVVGVLPPTFDFASIFAPSTRVDFLRPWPVSDETDQTGNSLSMIGRLAPGVTIPQAQAELESILAGLAAADPNRWGLGARTSALHEQIAGPYRSAMVLLGAAAATVMLIVCVNLSMLLMARGSRRRKEMAVRSALGATRGRLVRQLVVETLVLTLGGAAVGVGIAFGATRAVAASNSLDIPMLRTIGVDGGALLFTLALAVTAGLIMGIVPALQATGRPTAGAINDASRGSSAGRSITRIREALVVAEVAMACTLLVFGGLFLRSFQNVLDVDLGFQPDQAVAWTLSTNRSFEAIGEMNAFFEEVVTAVEAVPGVEEAGLIDALPLGRNRTWGTLRAQGFDYDDDELQSVFPHIVDHRYLSTMKIPLVAGRGFRPDDAREGPGPGAVLLNEAAAKAVFRGEDPIGRTVVNIGQEWEVVGVVADVRHQSAELGSGWQIYFYYGRLWGFQTLDLVVRSRLPAETLFGGVAAALRAADPAMPTGEFRTLTEIVDLSVSPRRFILMLLTAFGGTALLLAALGIYGVLSYSVTERIPEIGIRMALGETASLVQRRVVGKTLGLAGVGVAIGAVASLVGTRSIASLLYGVEPTDPATFGGMAVILLVVAALAGYLPALRASRADPTAAFRTV